MPKFDAGTAVDPLTYDFTKYVEGCQGEIPEPSDKQIEGFMEEIKGVAMTAGIQVGQDPTAMMQQMTERAQAAEEGGDDVFSVENLRRMNDTMMEAVATLCSQQPTADEIRGLPPRVRNAFFGWITGAFVDPEAGTAGLKN